MKKADSTLNKKDEPNIVGLVPAAGVAARIAPLPCSKELYPVGFQDFDGTREKRSKVVSQFLLERMSIAGVRNAYIVVRDGKLDIPTYFGDGSRLGMNLAYLMMRLPFGVPFTLDQAYSFCRASTVVMGFPDILFEPEDSFLQLLDRLEDTRATVTLGLYPTKEKNRSEMVRVDRHGRVLEIIIKPEQSELHSAWIIAAWTPVFTEYLHQYVSKQDDNLSTGKADEAQAECYLGKVFNQAIIDGLKIESVPFPDGRFTDIGTPDNLIRAVRDLNLECPT